MDEKKAQIFRDRLNIPSAEPLEATREFLLSYCLDKESMSEVESDIAYMARVNRRTLVAGLRGIDAILAGLPLDEGVLTRLVAWETGWVLKDETDTGAKAWLNELRDILRKHLGIEKQKVDLD